MSTKRKHKRIGPVWNIQTWPTCGECDREYNPDEDETYPGDDTFLFGWRCRCKAVSFTMEWEKVSKESTMPLRRFRVGSFITHGDELSYAPMGIGTNSYAVLPEKGDLASLAIVNESGKLEAWVMRDVPTKEAFDYLKEHGKPKDWDPDC